MGVDIHKVIGKISFKPKRGFVSQKVASCPDIHPSADQSIGQGTGGGETCHRFVLDRWQRMSAILDDFSLHWHHS